MSSAELISLSQQHIGVMKSWSEFALYSVESLRRLYRLRQIGQTLKNGDRVLAADASGLLDENFFRFSNSSNLLFWLEIGADREFLQILVKTFLETLPKPIHVSVFPKSNETQQCCTEGDENCQMRQTKPNFVVNSCDQDS